MKEKHNEEGKKNKSTKDRERQIETSFLRTFFLHYNKGGSVTQFLLYDRYMIII
jgi:hypothetical protein